MILNSDLECSDDCSGEGGGCLTHIPEDDRVMGSHAYIVLGYDPVSDEVKIHKVPRHDQECYDTIKESLRQQELHAYLA